LRAAAHRSAIGAIMIPAVMTSGSDIIAIAPATHPNEDGAAGAGFGGGGAAHRGGTGEGDGTKRGGAAARAAGGNGSRAGLAVSDR
jgi:hypothetical protein